VPEARVNEYELLRVNTKSRLTVPMEGLDGADVEDPSFDLVDGSKWRARGHGAQLAWARAASMTSVTAWGWEIMITCEPSTSVMVAPARWAWARTASVPAALSLVATTAQHGSFFHAGGPDLSEKPSSDTGR
jgi:hypothetical protein